MNTLQGQEIENSEVLLSRKGNLECGDCVSSIAGRRSAEETYDDFNVRSPMLAADLQHSAPSDTKPQEITEEKRSCCRSATIAAEEHDGLLSCPQASTEDKMGYVQERSETPSGDSTAKDVFRMDVDPTHADTCGRLNPTPVHHSWPNTQDTCHSCGNSCEGCAGTLPVSSVQLSSAIISAPLLPSHSSYSRSPASFSHPSLSPKTNLTSSPPNHSAPVNSDAVCICNENQRDSLTVVGDTAACVSSQWNEGEEHLEIKSDGGTGLYQSVRSPQECLHHDQSRLQGPNEITALSITRYLMLILFNYTERQKKSLSLLQSDAH